MLIPRLAMVVFAAASFSPELSGQPSANQLRILSEEITAYTEATDLTPKTALAKVSQDQKELYLFLSNMALKCEELPNNLNDKVLYSRPKANPDFILLVIVPNVPKLSKGTNMSIMFINPKRAYLSIIGGSVSIDRAGDLVSGNVAFKQQGGSFSFRLEVDARFAAGLCK